MSNRGQSTVEVDVYAVTLRTGWRYATVTIWRPVFPGSHLNGMTIDQWRCRAADGPALFDATVAKVREVVDRRGGTER